MDEKLEKQLFRILWTNSKPDYTNTKARLANIEQAFLSNGWKPPQKPAEEKKLADEIAKKYNSKRNDKDDLKRRNSMGLRSGDSNFIVRSKEPAGEADDSGSLAAWVKADQAEPAEGELVSDNQLRQIAIETFGSNDGIRFTFPKRGEAIQKAMEKVAEAQLAHDKARFQELQGICNRLMQDNTELTEKLARMVVPLNNRPTVVCLCGSTRFGNEFRLAQLNETLAGKIVLTIGCNMRNDAELFGNLPHEKIKAIKQKLDELHLRKIDMADEVLILDVAGYIGESTSNELEYAKKQNKKIRFISQEDILGNVPLPYG